jgi:hypothetical protein
VTKCPMERYVGPTVASKLEADVTLEHVKQPCGYGRVSAVRLYRLTLPWPEM